MYDRTKRVNRASQNAILIGLRLGQEKKAWQLCDLRLCLMQFLQTKPSARNEVAWCIEGAEAFLESFKRQHMLFETSTPQCDQMGLYIPSPPTDTALTFRSTMAAAAPGKCSSSCVGAGD